MANTNDCIINGEYRVARLDSDGVRDLETLHTATYGKEPPPGYYPRKYDTRFAGVQYTGYVAYDAFDKPVAYYGAVPCFLAYRQDVVLAAQGVDCMTHPDHRRKGLFVILAKMTLVLCRSKGIELVFGFANQNSFSGLINGLGWRTTGPLDRFTIPVAANLPMRIIRRAGGTNPVYRWYSDRALSACRLAVKGLTNACLAEGWAGVYRDDRFFDYKAYNPTYVVQVGGGRAWIRMSHELMIGDLSVADANFDHAITELTRLAARLGLRTMTCQLSPGTHLHGMFASRFPAQPSLPTVFGDLGTRLPVDKLKFTYADVDIF